LYVKKEHASKLKRPFTKLTELAAEAVRQANLPEAWKVTYCLTPTTSADRGAGGSGPRLDYIGVGKSNRRFQVGRESHRLSRYGPNVVKISHERRMLRRLEKHLAA